MPKVKVEIPMLTIAKSKGSEDMKGKKVAPKPDGGAMALGAPSMWKPPTHKQRMKEAAHGGAVQSMRDWVAGSISTKEHKENMKRHKMAVKGGGY